MPFPRPLLSARQLFTLAGTSNCCLTMLHMTSFCTGKIWKINQKTPPPTRIHSITCHSQSGVCRNIPDFRTHMGSAGLRGLSVSNTSHSFIKRLCPALSMDRIFLCYSAYWSTSYAVSIINSKYFPDGISLKKPTDVRRLKHPNGVWRTTCMLTRWHRCRGTGRAPWCSMSILLLHSSSPTAFA